MVSRHDSELPDDDSVQEEMESKSGKYQQYPPPQALPDYVNRALPPRPSSNSSTSSIYYSPGESTQGPTKPMVQLPVYQDGDEHLSPTHEGIRGEAGLATVQPFQPAVRATPPQSQEHTEIAAPQPRYPASKVLEVKNYVVSPVSASLLGNNSNNQQHDEVSPVSPGGSERSLHSRISESSRPSSPLSAAPAHGNPPSSASLLHRTPTNKSDRRRAVYKGYRTTQQHSSEEGDTASARSPRYQVHQINDRYSDPGSPISGAVIHPPTSFPSDPSLRSSRQLNEAKLQEEQEQQHQLPLTTSNDDHPSQSYQSIGGIPETSSPTGGARLATVPSAGSSGSQKVTFAGPQRSDSGFAARPRARTNSSRGGRGAATATATAKKKKPPPPLKLSERAIVDSYVKTPFPDLGGGGEGGEKREKEKEKERKEKEEEKPRSRFSHGRESISEDAGRGGSGGRGVWLGKGKDREKDREKDNESKEGDRNSAKKRNRVSSLPGFGLGIGRLLRSGSMNGGSSSKSEKEKGVGSEAEAQEQGQAQSPAAPAPSEVRAGYVETRRWPRPSRTPSVSKVKNMLSKAKQIGLNHGLGLAGMMSSEEAKKERRRAEMKRQIRVGEPRPV
ncbi:hypothetical protein F4820DRAFT_464462 [Hypoxylon rubiginosum]|uniref:Uncharacterized protein n=1 Tax=Hypoxylon rubiginosum TaxID=110542 RepID=A0ACB9YQM2_9PEZI|nr:hypothetical protein F4820DRAFT_464462 [Hypoxylon rubiginosum]